MKRTLRAGLVGISLIAFAVAPARAQFFGSGIVFDPSNYAQNVLTATRALQQINNQIQSLQNQAMMLQNIISPPLGARVASTRSNDALSSATLWSVGESGNTSNT